MKTLNEPVTKSRQEVHEQLTALSSSKTSEAKKLADAFKAVISSSGPLLTSIIGAARSEDWSKVGKPLNFARAEWQLARVYAVAGLPERARHHGQHCLEICQANRLGSFDLAFAWEALARAHAVAGDTAERGECLARAHEAAAQIADEEDRKVLMADLETVRAE